MTRHPAKYTDTFLPVFAELLRGYDRVLDPLAGTCKLGRIREHGYNGDIYCNELEPEWAMQAPYGVYVHIGDAGRMPFASGFFDAICTSPTYGNRMADHHNARDVSKRNTYTHAIGRKLTEGNTGTLQWASRRRRRLYGEAHKRIWREVHRVLKPNGRFILNIKDHQKRGRRMRVTLWHILCLKSLGFVMEEHRKVPVTGNGFGANGDKRIPYESIIVFRKG